MTIVVWSQIVDKVAVFGLRLLWGGESAKK